MLEALIGLAALASNTVVAAATTDAWEAARRKFAHLLGRSGPGKEQLAEQRLEETHQQLTAAAGGATWSRYVPRRRSGGRAGSRTCWRRIRVSRLTCGAW